MATLSLSRPAAVGIWSNVSARFVRSRWFRVLVTTVLIVAADFFVESAPVMVSIMPASIGTIEDLVLTQLVNFTWQALLITLCLEVFWWIQSLKVSAAMQVLAGGILLLVPPLMSPLSLQVPLSYDALYRAGLIASQEDLAFHGVWETAVQTVIASVYLVRRRHVFEQQTRRESVAREWQDANRAILESRMQAIQARVEPQLLFDALASMREFYAIDLKQGEALLESLTEFLRRGLPRTRSVTSTVGLEIDLLKSYVDLERMAGLAKPSLDVHVTEQVALRIMAAGVLQPLIATWLRMAGPATEARFQLSARAEGAMTSIRVLGPRTDLSEYLAKIEAGLRDSHGAASVDSRITNGQLECRLEYPDDIDHIEHAAT